MPVEGVHVHAGGACAEHLTGESRGVLDAVLMLGVRIDGAIRSGEPVEVPQELVPLSSVASTSREVARSPPAAP